VNQGGTWVVKWGALPRAMTYTEDANGHESYPEKGGTGKTLHIDELTRAKEEVANSCLQLRGDGRRVAEKIKLWEDRGQEVFAGRDFFVVTTFNPVDDTSFKAVQALDKALLRGVTLLRLGDLCEDSWNLCARKILSFSIGNMPELDPIQTPFLFHQNADLLEVIADTVLTFHLEYRQALKDDPEERNREEKVMASMDDLFECARNLLLTQATDAMGMVDMVETVRDAIERVYLGRHLEGSDFRKTMKKHLDTLLDQKATGGLEFRGTVHKRSDIIRQLVDGMNADPQMAAPAAGQTLEAALGAFAADPGMDEALKKAMGLM
jgi:hypothetical protein